MEFICVNKCEELDHDGSKHCQTNDPDSFADRYNGSCPTGQSPIWESTVAEKLKELIIQYQKVLELEKNLRETEGIRICSFSKSIQVYAGIEKVIPLCTNVHHNNDNDLIGYIHDMKIFQLPDFNDDGDIYYLEAEYEQDD